MNIHFNNSELFKDLLENTIVSFQVGSHLYNISDKESDNDVLCIYYPSNYELNNFFFLHHQLQYKVNNTDYLFTSLNGFIHNLINGDSTINFEVLQAGLFDGTDLEFLSSYVEDSKNFSVIRSFLGMARRDVNGFSKRNSDRDKVKGLYHIMRGYYSAKQLINDDYDFYAILEFLNMTINSGGFSDEVKINKTVKMYSKKITELREVNNSIRPTIDIPKYMESERMYQLTKELNNYLRLNKKTLLSNSEEELMRLYIDAFENGVIYKKED